MDGKTTMKTWMRDERDNDTLANAMQCDKTYLIIWHYLLQLSKHQSGKDTNIIPKVMFSNKTIVAGRQTNFQITSWPLILIVSNNTYIKYEPNIHICSFLEHFSPFTWFIMSRNMRNNEIEMEAIGGD